MRALHEGDALAPWETVMTIEGDYSLFAHLETVYLGCMARRTLVMRNVRRVVEAARGKPILFFPARHDHWLVQTGDGWAAHVAGAIGVSTDAQASWWGGRGVGTVPHGLIAAYGGDTVQAARGVRRAASRSEMNVTVLVDFANDSVATALEVAERARGATSGACAWTPPTSSPTWRCRSATATRPRRASRPSWCALTREQLDAHGFHDVKIVVSGGFTAERIAAFEDAGVPVDAYGVGSSLLRGANDFTADVVMVDGAPGRQGRARAAARTRGSAPSARGDQRHEAHALEPRRARSCAAVARASAARCWSPPSSTGATSRPPGASWASSAGGTRRRAAAATLIAS